MKTTLKTSFYFQHDYNAQNHRKIIALCGKFGIHIGYSTYFRLLEFMAESGDGWLEEDLISGFAPRLDMSAEHLNEIINYCVTIGLFIKENSKVGSERMLEHIKFRGEKASEARKSAQKRWKSTNSKASERNANAMRTHSERNANAMQRKGKERKEKESNINPSIDLPVKPASPLEIIKPLISPLHGAKEDEPKATELPKVKTDIQEIVETWKVVSGVDINDKAWDKDHFARNTKAAKQLLAYLGSVEEAKNCIEDIYDEFTEKNLTVTLETIFKHSDKYKNGTLFKPKQMNFEQRTAYDAFAKLRSKSQG